MDHGQRVFYNATYGVRNRMLALVGDGVVLYGRVVVDEHNGGATLCWSLVLPNI